VRTRLVVATIAALSLLATACSRADSSAGDTEDTDSQDKGAATELRLGYFPNVTHAPALIGLEKACSRRSWARPS
jgi:NitT/TauT family transport system substrate-binding protein